MMYLNSNLDFLDDISSETLYSFHWKIKTWTSYQKKYTFLMSKKDFEWSDYNNLSVQKTYTSKNWGLNEPKLNFVLVTLCCKAVISLNSQSGIPDSAPQKGRKPCFPGIHLFCSSLSSPLSSAQLPALALLCLLRKLIQITKRAKRKRKGKKSSGLPFPKKNKISFLAGI